MRPSLERCVPAITTAELTSLAQFERQLPGPEREFQLGGMEEGPLVVPTGIEPESPKNANDAEGFDVIDISKLKKVGD